MSYKKVEKSYIEFTKLNEANHELNYFTNILTNNTLGYMDAIVDKDSGDVDGEIVKKHMAFNDWVTKEKANFSAHIQYVNPNFELEKFFTGIHTYWMAGSNMIADIKNKKIDGLDAYDDDIDGSNEALQVETAELLKNSSLKFSKASSELESAQQMISNSSIISLISVLLCGLLIGIYIIRSINFTLNSAGKKLSDGATTVLNSSISFADLGILIKDSTSKQASSLQESVSAVEEIKATIERNTELSNQSVTIADICVESSQKGKNAVKEMLSAVESIENDQKNIKKTLQDTTNEVKEIVTIIKNISQKTDIINDIVFQTKLLSFNASVESSRAGEHGKGFAVVAQEIGNLAAMSGTAAMEINQLLNSSIEKVGSIVEKTERNSMEISHSSAKSIELGVIKAQNCDDSLMEIYGHMEKMKELIREINASSNEQNQGINSISIALNELDNLTNENVLSAEKCASSANVLSEQSKMLEYTVGDLFVELKG